MLGNVHVVSLFESAFITYSKLSKYVSQLLEASQSEHSIFVFSLLVFLYRFALDHRVIAFSNTDYSTAL